MRNFAAALVFAMWPAFVHAQASEDSRRYTVPVQQLTGTTIINDKGLSLPTRIMLLDGVMVVLDRRADRVVRIYDPTTGSTLRTFGQRGGGPGEFAGAWDLFPGLGQRDFWVFDVSLRRLTRIHLDSSFVGSRYNPMEMITIGSEAPFEGARWFADGRLFSTGDYTTGQLGVHSPSGSFIGTKRRLILGDPRISALARQQAYAARPDALKSSPLLVLAYRWTDRIDIIDTAGVLRASVARPFGFEPILSKQAGERAVFTNQTRRGFVGTSLTEQSIFALFSGRTSEEHGQDYGFGVDVLDYSWNGQLRAVFRLEADAIAIAADNRANVLYALSYDPVPAVVRYTMKGR